MLAGDCKASLCTIRNCTHRVLLKEKNSMNLLHYPIRRFSDRVFLACFVFLRRNKFEGFLGARTLSVAVVGNVVVSTEQGGGGLLCCGLREHSGSGSGLRLVCLEYITGAPAF